MMGRFGTEMVRPALGAVVITRIGLEVPQNAFVRIPEVILRR